MRAACRIDRFVSWQYAGQISRREPSLYVYLALSNLLQQTTDKNAILGNGLNLGHADHTDHTEVHALWTGKLAAKRSLDLRAVST
jgi:hypothetical protein